MGKPARINGRCVVAIFAILGAAGCHGRDGGSSIGPVGGDGGRASMTASALIGSEGGMVALGDDISVMIPAGALSESTMIRLSFGGAAAVPMPTGFDAAGPSVVLTPHGQTFAVPIEIRIPYDGDPADAAAFWRMDESDQVWKRHERVTVEGDVAVIETDHFSDHIATKSSAAAPMNPTDRNPTDSTAPDTGTTDTRAGDPQDAGTPDTSTGVTTSTPDSGAADAETATRDGTRSTDLATADPTDAATPGTDTTTTEAGTDGTGSGPALADAATATAAPAAI